MHVSLSLSHSLGVTGGLSKPVRVCVMREEALSDPLEISLLSACLHLSHSPLEMAISAEVSVRTFYCAALALNVMSGSKA